ncbi:MAG: SMP-30/gluconolactonase/LRE family protein, partial [Amphiplicatus sp.]
MVKIAITACVIATLAAAPLLAADPVVIADVGFVGPEAARYDERRDEYIVSNLGSRGEGNDGFISRVAPDGSVVSLKWIAGGAKGVTLIDPLGIYAKGDKLYVADVNAVRIFDRKSGAAKGSVEVSDAVRLNDLVVDDNGVIYVTDSGNAESAGAIYKITPGGDVSPFMERGPSLERPNGITINADGNVVYGGRGVNIVFRTPEGELVREQTLPTGQFDGFVLMPDGDLLIASQLGHNVYRVAPDGGEVSVVADGFEVPAAIGLDAK